MNTSTNQTSALTYTERLSHVLKQLDHAAIDRAVALIESAWKAGKQIITLGNGGSSLTALHYINDWNKSIYLSHGVPFRGRSLVDNVGLLMSYANDIAFEDVFSEQLKNILEPGDLVIALSGSGNSENVIRAVDYANSHGAITLGLCGYRGGRLKEKAQQVIWVDADDMQLAEDVHFVFGHIVMQRLCAK
ncbi:SIS domain-containing protein [Polynucleobacter sp. IMCC 30228]|uniref:SIS domain-containing protein n=1 Tax=Polynucleobacter sp. IMCC 30228 TaxID=2781011 RepID=UPI001F25C980|nr:SIS domain-containing protein [Polynucleobacter sp. IMCC 30228]MCE7527823.1 SIS domain-containing protein [Polynucleobacter sp. IMCC 30228]